MTDTVYRFLPWSRRGLAAAIPGTADGVAVPDRAKVSIDVVVAGAGTVNTSTTLHGPGDVIGLDPTVIVRTTPRPNATNVETNFVAAVDFDQPELPWLFTPTGAPTSGHLRPWLVLVVVRDRPGVSVTLQPGWVLPRLVIESGALQELPDLTDSWAWAHAQLLDTDAGSSAAAVGQALADHPDRNVSRLVCPRRLEPDSRWIACLVPAFDAGVVRGRGGTPPTGQDLKPAWAAPDTVELPVYFHWSFQTGPQGDFESLARRLKPYEASATIGRVKMHIGDASPFVDLPLDAPDRFLDMDGALQAPAVARADAQPPVPDPDLGQVPDLVRTGLQDVSRILADAADGKLDGQSPGDSDALGPPVYAGGHVRRTQVDDGDPTWFRELNTDPRSRVAAGLGAEVMRTNQEDVMSACWEQVGDVVGVQSALSRARLSLELGRRFQERHVAPQSPGRLLQFLGPLAGRTLLAGVTLPTAIASTSFPDRATDGALRRFTAPTGRVVSGIARRANQARATGVRAAALSAGESLVTSLAAGRDDIDATRFSMVALDGFDQALPAADQAGKVPLDRFGLSVVLERPDAQALRKASTDLKTAPQLTASEMLAPRSDPRRTGLLSDAHLEAARTVAAAQLDAELAKVPAGERPPLRDLFDVSSSSVLSIVTKEATGGRGDAGFLVQTGASISASSLAVGSGDRLVVVTPDGHQNVDVARIDPRLRSRVGGIGSVVGSLPAGTISAVSVRRGRVSVAGPEVVFTPGAGTGEVVATSLGNVVAGTGRGEPMDAGATITMPPLVTDAATIARFEQAIVAVVDRTALGSEAVSPTLVAFGLSEAVAATIAGCDPAVVHPRRLDTMVTIGGRGLLSLVADASLLPAWRIGALLDRVMAYPHLDLPAYTYLAAYDRTRFCPGVDEVPPESVTLLETNPRFVAGFMAGLNHETAQELMWRGFPSDGRGTPWRKFWRRADGGPDIFEMHQWGARPVGGGNRDDLPAQTTDPQGNLVLLLRGDLIRRYPNTMVVAVRAVLDGSRQMPSSNPADVRTQVFAGQFDPDVSFFGFPLTSADLTSGQGWFFGVMEPVTEPRFGFDETVGRSGGGGPTTWNDVAWPDLGVLPGAMLTPSALAALGVAPGVGQADGVAAALFQRPFKLLVHARHLVKGI